LKQEINYDDIWKKKWGDMQEFGPIHRHTRRITLNILKKIKFNTVLDAGCGIGFMLNCIKKYFNPVSLTGIDISEEAINICKSIYPNYIFYVKDLQKESLNQKFDLIICMDVIEHIENDSEFLKNISSMCNKYFLISTLLGRMRNFEKSIGHFRNYNKDELVRLLESQGFKIKFLRRWGFPLYSPLYRNFLDKPGSEKISTGNKFSIFQKIIAYIGYFIFYLTVPDKGDIIFILCEK